MHRKKGIVVAIDGPTASGKSTTAKLVAERLGYLHLNTGAMYRAFALFAHRNNLDPADLGGVKSLLQKTSIAFASDGNVTLNGEDVSKEIIQPTIATLASQFSSIAEVREMLVARQRELGADGGVVLEGRDIGTVVFPDAELKIFLIAGPKVRALRRMEEFAASGIDISLEQLTSQIEDRDRRDTEREISPLRKAPDATALDTSNLTIPEQVEEVVRLAEEAIKLNRS
jgi:cytidylate kinase